MSSDRVIFYLNEIDVAASRVRNFVRGMDEAAFYADDRTQMAVMMGLALIGEAVVKIDKHDPEFLKQHPDIPWAKIRGMRNLIVHDYFRAELPVIWDTVNQNIPDLQAQLTLLQNWRAQGE